MDRAWVGQAWADPVWAARASAVVSAQGRRVIAQALVLRDWEARLSAVPALGGRPLAAPHLRRRNRVQVQPPVVCLAVSPNRARVHSQAPVDPKAHGVKWGRRSAGLAFSLTDKSSALPYLQIAEASHVAHK